MAAGRGDGWVRLQWRVAVWRQVRGAGAGVVLGLRRWGRDRDWQRRSNGEWGAEGGEEASRSSGVHGLTAPG
ncbi:hypothetical protein [Corynebacterium sp. MC3]|uniref:hypothetical protein n=1 Tax=Corynebacterium sp. MC3 TaxID=1720193 RepID=UPI00115F8054|nr:hypothetical protein [Corynebacterium sp. MC3]